MVVAENGLEGLAALKKERFGLILMDCQMSEMDGFEATRCTRKGEGGHPDVPIIAVTANVMSGDRERCLDAGMNDYMKKPIKRDLLEAKLNHWLSDNKVINISRAKKKDG